MDADEFLKPGKPKKRRRPAILPPMMFLGCNVLLLMWSAHSPQSDSTNRASSSHVDDGQAGRPACCAWPCTIKLENLTDE
jgi:hypothetical protein